jgi:hypothetical protein
MKINEDEGLAGGPTSFRSLTTTMIYQKNMTFLIYHRSCMRMKRTGASDHRNARPGYLKQKSRG